MFGYVMQELRGSQEMTEGSKYSSKSEKGVKNMETQGYEKGSIMPRRGIKGKSPEPTIKVTLYTTT